MDARASIVRGLQLDQFDWSKRKNGRKNACIVVEKKRSREKEKEREKEGDGCSDGYNEASALNVKQFQREDEKKRIRGGYVEPSTDCNRVALPVR